MHVCLVILLGPNAIKETNGMFPHPIQISHFAANCHFWSLFWLNMCTEHVIVVWADWNNTSPHFWQEGQPGHSIHEKLALAGNSLSVKGNPGNGFSENEAVALENVSYLFFVVWGFYFVS